MEKQQRGTRKLGTMVPRDITHWGSLLQLSRVLSVMEIASFYDLFPLKNNFPLIFYVTRGETVVITKVY